MKTTNPTTTVQAQPENAFQDVVADRSFIAPAGYDKGSILKACAQAYQLKGNQHPHFSVTGEIGTQRQFDKGDFQSGGCIHEEISKAWPTIRPIIALHLSNANDGEPMHAESNGYYWLAGAVGGLGEEYHGGSGSSAKTPDECLHLLADHLRITFAEATLISGEIRNAYNKAFSEYEAPETGPTLNRQNPFQKDQHKTASNAARSVFHNFIIAQHDRWQKEASEGLALIRKLA